MLNKFKSVSKNISPNLRKVIGNTGWLFTEKLVQMGLGLYIGVWITRYLGPTQFGRFNYAGAIAGIFVPIAKLGLDSIVIRNLARDSSNKEEILGTAFALKFIGSIFTLFLTLAVIFASTSNIDSNDIETRWLVAIIAGGTIIQSFDVIDYWFQSQIESKYAVWARNTAYILMNGVKLVLILMKAPLIAFALAIVTESALSTIIMVTLYQFKGSLINAWKINISQAKILLKDSWPLILSGVVIIIYMRIDQVMLGQMNGEETVGVYSVAVKISELWYFVPISIVNSVFPSIVTAKEINEKVYSERMQKMLNILAALAYVVAIPVTFLSTTIVTLIYGESYADAGIILTVHIWAGLFVSLGVARETWLTTEGLMKFSAVTTAIGAAINVVLNLFLIKSYGGLGAAIATVTAQIVAAYGVGAFYPPTRKIFIQQTKAIFLLGWFQKS